MGEHAPLIAKIEKSMREARASAIVDIKSAQMTCPHEHVVADSRSGYWGGRRICVRCGLEEVSAYSWPGTTVDGGFYEFVRPAGLRTILNSEYVKIDEVMKYRVYL